MDRRFEANHACCKKIHKELKEALGFSTVSILKNGNFILTTGQKATDILLMGQNHRQRNCNGEYPVGYVVYIEDDEYEYGESEAGQDRAQRYESG